MLGMANIWRFTLAGTDDSGNQEWNSTMHYQTDGVTGAGEPPASEVLAEIIEHYGTGGGGVGMERWTVTVYPSVKLTSAAVYQELDPTSTDIPEAARRELALSGQAATGDELEPFALCPWIKFGTGLASRSARGGTHGAPVIATYALDDGGLFDTGTAWWSALDDLAGYMLDRLASPFDGFLGVDLQPVIYSRTRRARGQTPFTFDLSSAAPSRVPRFLRRRDVGR
jgi:hypothetical protein